MPDAPEQFRTGWVDEEPGFEWDAEYYHVPISFMCLGPKRPTPSGILYSHFMRASLKRRTGSSLMMTIQSTRSCDYLTNGVFSPQLVGGFSILREVRNLLIRDSIDHIRIEDADHIRHSVPWKRSALLEVSDALQAVRAETPLPSILFMFLYGLSEDELEAWESEARGCLETATARSAWEDFLEAHLRAYSDARPSLSSSESEDAGSETGEAISENTELLADTARWRDFQGPTLFRSR
jgi:hypothetical protein